MDKRTLETRTRRFAVAIIRMSAATARSREADVLLRQLIASSSSIGANYREANRAESRKDFIRKIGVVEKEAAETEYWLELLAESELVPAPTIAPLQVEAKELLAIFTAIGRTAKRNLGVTQIKDGEGSGLDFDGD